MGSKRIKGFVIGAVVSVAGVMTGQAWLTSIGVSMAVGALASKNLSNKQRAALSTAGTPEAALPVIYGTARVGVSIVDIRVDPGNNKRLAIVAAICVGSEDGSGIYTPNMSVSLNDRLAISNPAAGNAPLTTGVQTTFQKDGAYYLHYGLHDGANAQAVDTELTALFPTEWPSTSQGNGIAYIVLLLTHHKDIYPSGIPTITVRANGVKVFDPRNSLTGWSANPALCIRDYLTSKKYGCGVPASEIDDTSFIDAANYCDELVNTGAINQNRFRCNGVIDTARPRSENLKALLSSCRGELVYQSGKFRLVIRKPTVAASFKLTEDNIIGDWDIVRSGSQVPNSVNVGYVDAASYNDQVREVTWPEAGQANGFLTADNNLPAVATIELPFTRNYYTAQQIGMVTLREAREDVSIGVTVKEDALKLQVGDVVPLTHSTPGFTDKLFWVTGLAILPDTNVRLQLREYDAAAYTLDTQNTDPAVPASNLPNPFTVAAPTNFQLLSDTTTALPTQDEQYVPRIRASWTASIDPFLSHYEVRYRKTADSQWIAAPNVLAGTNQTFVAPVSDATEYTVEARAINSLGVPSAWVTGAVLTSTQPGFTNADVQETVDAQGQISLSIRYPAGALSFSYVANLSGHVAATTGHRVTTAIGPVTVLNRTDVNNNPIIASSAQGVYLTGWFWSNNNGTGIQSAPVKIFIRRPTVILPSVSAEKSISATALCTTALTIMDPDARLSAVSPVTVQLSQDGGLTYGAETALTLSGGKYTYQFTAADLNKRYLVKWRVYYRDSTETETHISDVAEFNLADLPTLQPTIQFLKYRSVLASNLNGKVRSFKYKFSTVSQPTAADVRATGTLVNQDGSTTPGWTLVTPDPVPGGTTLYLTMIGYSAAAAGGVEGPVYEINRFRQLPEVPGGTVDYAINPITGRVDLTFRGNSSAGSIKYAINTSAFITDPANAAVRPVVNVERTSYTVGFGIEDLWSWARGTVLNAATLLGPEDVVFLSVWFYETSDHTGTPGPRIGMVLTGEDRPTDPESDPDNMLFNGSGWYDIRSWKRRTIAANLSFDDVIKKRGIGSFKIDHTGTINSVRVIGTQTANLLATPAAASAGVSFSEPLLTVEARIYAPAIPIAGLTLCEWGTPGTSHRIRIASTGEVMVRISAVSTSGVASNIEVGTGVILEAGGYHMLSVVFDGANVSVAVDGVYQATVAALSGSAQAATISSATGANAFRVLPDAQECYIDELRVWNIARPMDELRTDCHKKLNGTEYGLRGLWKFQEGAGTSVADSSGKGQTMTLHATGTAWAANRIGDEEWSQDYNVKDGDVIEVSGWLEVANLAGAGQGALLKTEIVSGVTALTLLQADSTSTGFTGTGVYVGIATAVGTLAFAFQRAQFRVSGTGVLRTSMQLGKGGSVTGRASFDDVTVKRVASYVFNEAETGRKGAGTAPTTALRNGGAQEDTANWTNDLGTLRVDKNVLTTARFGDRCFYFDHTAAAAESKAYQDVVVAAGETIYATGWIAASALTAGARDVLDLSTPDTAMVAVVDTVAPYVGEADSNGFKRFGIAANLGFTYVSQTLRVLAGGTIRFGIRAGATGALTAGQHFFDGLSLVISRGIENTRDASIKDAVATGTSVALSSEALTRSGVRGVQGDEDLAMDMYDATGATKIVDAVTRQVLSVLLGSDVTDANARAIARMLAKGNTADPDNIDSVPDGTLNGKTLLTALTSGQIDLSKAGVINKILANIARSGGDATTAATILQYIANSGHAGASMQNSVAKLLNLLYAKTNSADPDTADSVATGAVKQVTTINEATGANRAFNTHKSTTALKVGTDIEDALGVDRDLENVRDAHLKAAFQAGVAYGTIQEQLTRDGVRGVAGSEALALDLYDAAGVTRILDAGSRTLLDIFLKDTTDSVTADFHQVRREILANALFYGS